MIAVDIGEAQESLLSGFVGKGLNLFWQKKSQMIAAKALPDEKVPSLKRRDVWFHSQETMREAAMD